MEPVVDDLYQVRQIVLKKLRNYPVKVFLFGSRAKGTERRTSDIDVAILPRSPLPAGVLSEIRQILEESNVLYTVELVDLSEADPVFRERVLREGIPWTG